MTSESRFIIRDQGARWHCIRTQELFTYSPGTEQTTHAACAPGCLSVCFVSLQHLDNDVSGQHIIRLLIRNIPNSSSWGGVKIRHRLLGSIQPSPSTSTSRNGVRSICLPSEILPGAECYGGWVHPSWAQVQGPHRQVYTSTPMQTFM